MRIEPHEEPRLGLGALRFVGTGLVRPECVLAHRSGWLFCADWQGAGGVAAVAPDRRVRRVTATGLPRPLRPNGIALEPHGRFLLADLGDEVGGVFRLYPDGGVEPVVAAVDGHPLPPTNYVHRDREGRIYVTVSTRLRPRTLGCRADVADGFVVLVDAKGARVVADGLGYTNECVVSACGGYLYVNETFARRLSRFPRHADGTLGAREVVTTFGVGTFPDGLTLDREGGLWITSIVSNRVIRLAPDGREELWLEDADLEHVASCEAAYVAGELGRAQLDRVTGRKLRNVSSLAFGGPDLTTAYLGCLLGDAIASFESPIPGAAPPHWDLPLGPLVEGW